MIFTNIMLEKESQSVLKHIYNKIHKGIQFDLNQRMTYKKKLFSFLLLMLEKWLTVWGEMHESIYDWM